MNTMNKRDLLRNFALVAGLIWAKLLLLRILFYGRIDWAWIAADLAPVVLVMGLLAIVVPVRFRRGAYLAFDVLVSLVLFAATVYFNHFGSVPTYVALQELHQVFQVKDSVESTVQAVDYLYFADFILLAAFAILRKWRRSRRTVYPSLGGGYEWRDSRPGSRRAMLAAALLAVIAGGLLSAYYIRETKELTNELVHAESAGFINYQVAAAISAHEDNGLHLKGDINDTIAQIAALQATYPYGGKSGAAQPDYFASQKGKNVIVVQMEAFQNFPIHQTLAGQELTPNLNKLADEGFYFPQVYQQIGSGNTSDAEFMSNTSIYPLGAIPMSSGFGDRELPSLPRLLRDKGYEAYTFHVNSVGFWNRNQLYPALGFTGYYDKKYFYNDHFNAFGASDEQLYITALEKLSALQRKGTPFYAQLVTASSHHPFQIPDSFKKIAVPEELQGTMLGDYLTAINYTDYAIGKLVEGLKQDGLWENTVLVFYGDHFGLQPQNVDPEQVTAALGIPYDSQVSRFNIPLIVHTPGMAQGKAVEQTGGQLDILPTIANLLGISLKTEGFTAFGHDLLNIGRNVQGMRYYLPTGSFFNDDIMFVPGKGFADGKAVSLKTLQPVEDFSRYESDYDYILELERLSDQYVKLLPQR
ncbi:LTA synthase family protein [Paenibacillus sp. NFR01]|uniref:LTA synthase family protein n=1 Tax=Paenibacillus sp. NFR01 TaxID=1566279 RepID=UPI0008C9FCD0|nr:Phosphoglycerol transferase MdoB [Paenibacillus sp. NFR01]